MATGLAAATGVAAAETPDGVRAEIRQGRHTVPTSGLAPGWAQANLVVLPAADALDFARFCARNAKSCPLLEITDPGSPHPDAVATEADVRTDVPRYRVFRDGELIDEPTDMSPHWRDDLVAFLLGCSFTFEWALTAEGLTPAHQRLGVNVPMFITNRHCVPSGRFEGPMVVSMRPYTPRDAAHAAEITSHFPAMHGAPVHIGDPGALGITDLDAPDFGDPVPLGPDEVPVFWACGVTPQAVVLNARPALAIFHAPGHMFVTDRPHSAFDTREPSTRGSTEDVHS